MAGLAALLLASMAAAEPLPAQSDAWALCRGGPLFDWLDPAAQAARPRAAAPTDLEADHFDVSGEDVYRLSGDVRLRRADQHLRADRLDYAHSAATYRAEGDVRYQDRSVAVSAASIAGDLVADRSRMESLRYQLIALRGNGEADSAEFVGPRGDLQAVDYSTCDPGQRSWSLRAQTMHLDRESGMGSMRNATLRLGKVPVLWLPYASFPIDERRRSGFLYPSLGYDDKSGIDLRVPYYLNLAPHYDATLNVRALGRRGVMLGAEFRYLGERHRGQFEGDWLPDDDLADRDRGYFRWRHQGVLGPDWRLLADIQNVSDDRYFEDFGDSLLSASTSLVESRIGLRGRGDYWTASVFAHDWDITDPAIADSAAPFRRLPRAVFRYDRPLADWLRIGLASEAVLFDHDDRPAGSRYDLTPWLALPLERAWGYLRPQLAWRQTGYSLERGFIERGFSDRSPERGTPIASLDAGLIFERATRLFGRSMLQTLEPRLYYLRVPYRNQDDLPLFDTQEFTFSFGQLFRSNRFTGADRQMDANQATLAITTRLFESDSGRERLSASLGQIRYFDDQRVQLPGRPPGERSGSAYVGELELALSERFGVGLTQQWDPQIDATTVTGVRAYWQGAAGALVNLGYRYRRGALEQTDASFIVPFNPAWRLVGRWNYSLYDASTLEGMLGVEWEGCCIAVRTLGRHYVRNREGEKNNALYVELELKGLGSFGRDTGELLQRAIVGYARD